jgi:hypothetical protein
VYYLDRKESPESIGMTVNSVGKLATRRNLELDVAMIIGTVHYVSECEPTGEPPDRPSLAQLAFWDTLIVFTLYRLAKELSDDYQCWHWQR